MILESWAEKTFVTLIKWLINIISVRQFPSIYS